MEEWNYSSVLLYESLTRQYNLRINIHVKYLRLPFNMLPEGCLSRIYWRLLFLRTSFVNMRLVIDTIIWLSPTVQCFIPFCTTFCFLAKSGTAKLDVPDVHFLWCFQSMCISVASDARWHSRLSGHFPVWSEDCWSFGVVMSEWEQDVEEESST